MQSHPAQTHYTLCVLWDLVQISECYAAVISSYNWKHLPTIPSDDICCIFEITTVTNTLLFPAEKMSMILSLCFSPLLFLPFVCVQSCNNIVTF